MSDFLPQGMVQAILTAKAGYDRAQPPASTLDAIHNASLACEGRMVCPFADLNYGHLACAFAVNRVVQFARGVPVDTSIDTATLFSTLFHGAGTSTNGHQPGTIVISPTQGDIHGHVGILGENDKIYSNSSVVTTLGIFMQNYDWQSWQQDLQDNRGLKTYLFTIS